MVTIEQLFRQAQQAGAAEIYLMAGRKPAARIGGKIKNLDYPELSSTEAEKILLEMLDAKQAAQYRETKSVDEVIAFHGIGRFRVHIYQNDGVPSACVKIINKKEGLPEELKALAGITQGLVLVCGKPQRKECHTCGTGRTDACRTFYASCNAGKSRRISDRSRKRAVKPPLYRKRYRFL